MARIRTIKPEFYRDERIADLSYPAAFHFPGLWLLADRAGRLRDRPREIKAEIAPLRKVDMEEVLVELATAGLIVRYAVEGVRYIQVVNLERHQRFNNREPGSSIPPPNSSAISNSLKPAQADLSTHVRAVEEGKGREWKGREKNCSRRTRLPTEFVWTDARKAVAVKYKVREPAEEFAKFVTHFEATGGVMLDWDKAWAKWCMRSHEFAGRANGNGHREKFQHTQVIPSVEETRQAHLRRMRGE